MANMETQTKQIENKIRSLLKKHSILTRKGLIKSLLETIPSVKVSSIDWVLHKLKEKRVLVNVGRGKYSLQEVSKFSPELSSKLEWIYSKIQKRYEPDEALLWETRWLHEFMTHLPFASMIVIEIEQDLLESVYYFIKENVKNEVYLLNGFANKKANLGGLMDQYVLETRDPIVVKRLVSRSPKQRLGKVKSPTLEKILVDVFSDPVLFTTYHGGELENIFTKAFNRYALDRKRMMSYAKRRAVDHQLSEFLEACVDGKDT